MHDSRMFRMALVFVLWLQNRAYWLTELDIVVPFLIANKKERKFFGNICLPKYFFETKGRLRSSFDFSRPKPENNCV